MSSLRLRLYITKGVAVLIFYASFWYINAISQAGPIIRNCKSSKNEGFAPSILCPTNCPIQAKTNNANEDCHKGMLFLLGLILQAEYCPKGKI